MSDPIRHECWLALRLGAPCPNAEHMEQREAAIDLLVRSIASMEEQAGIMPTRTYSERVDVWREYADGAPY